MSDPGDSWLPAFLGAAALFILFRAWRGWRLGIVRQVAGLLAMAAAGLCAVYGGSVLTPWVRALVPGPDRVVAVLAGALLAVVVFVSIKLLSALVFKRTEHQSVGLVRFGYGLAGAAVGAAYGLVLVWLAVLGVRLLGTVAQTQLAVEKNPRFRAPAGATPAPAGRVIGGLAGLKTALEQGTVGSVVERLDPIPGTAYSTLGKLGRVAADPRSIERLAHFPGVRPLLAEPKLTALLNDPAIVRAASAREYGTLLTNPRVVAAANDPELAAKLRSIDLEKALDYALAGREPAASNQ